MTPKELLETHVTTVDEFHAEDTSGFGEQDQLNYCLNSDRAVKCQSLLAALGEYEIEENSAHEIEITRKEQDGWQLECRDSHFQTAVYSRSGRYRLISHKIPRCIYEMPADVDLECLHSEVLDRKLIESLNEMRHELSTNDEFCNTRQNLLSIYLPKEEAISQLLQHYYIQTVQELRQHYQQPTYQPSAKAQAEIESILTGTT